MCHSPFELIFFARCAALLNFDGHSWQISFITRFVAQLTHASALSLLSKECFMTRIQLRRRLIWTSFAYALLFYAGVISVLGLADFVSS